MSEETEGIQKNLDANHDEGSTARAMRTQHNRVAATKPGTQRSTYVWANQIHRCRSRVRLVRKRAFGEGRERGKGEEKREWGEGRQRTSCRRG